MFLEIQIEFIFSFSNLILQLILFHLVAKAAFLILVSSNVCILFYFSYISNKEMKWNENDLQSFSFS